MNREETLQTSKRAFEFAPDVAESHVSSGIAHCLVQDYGIIRGPTLRKDSGFISGLGSKRADGREGSSKRYV